MEERYAPLPTAGQLQALGIQLGAEVAHERRVLGGLGGTIDVLRAGEEPVVLKRYWLLEGDEPDPSESEFRALALASEHGVPAPMPIWLDREGLFPERAIVMSFLDGAPNLAPRDLDDWALQLAGAVWAIQQIRAAPGDEAIFPRLVSEDPHHDDAELRQLAEDHLLGPLWEATEEARAGLAPVEPVYIHHDFWPGNTLWVDEQLVAIIDWEGGAIGDPAVDVAYAELDIRLLGYQAAADRFVAACRDRSPSSLVNLRYWRLMALFRPLDGLSYWVQGWNQMGVPTTLENASRRYDDLVRGALGASS